MLRDPVSRRGLEGIFKTGQLPDVREAFLRRWASTERNSPQKQRHCRQIGGITSTGVTSGAT
jgi:hypothetical protein